MDGTASAFELEILIVGEDVNFLVLQSEGHRIPLQRTNLLRGLFLERKSLFETLKDETNF